MGTIIYKPHCGKCGAIINQEIAYIRYDGGFIETEPYKCTYCGEIFETIEIPMPKEWNNTIRRDNTWE